MAKKIAVATTQGGVLETSIQVDSDGSQMSPTSNSGKFLIAALGISAVAGFGYLFMRNKAGNSGK